MADSRRGKAKRDKNVPSLSPLTHFNCKEINMKDIGETHEDEALLDATVAAVQSAGSHLMERFSADAPRFRNLAEIVAAIHANDEASLALLREPLMAARPGSQWAEEEDEGGEL